MSVRGGAGRRGLGRHGIGPRPRPAGDGGFTLTEMIVTVAILAVVMLLTTGAVLQANTTSARVEAAGTAQSEIHRAFDTLDRQVRWASGFSTPGTMGGDPVVEFLFSFDATPTCYQLRLHSAAEQLQERSWVQGSTDTTPWRILADRVVASPDQQPFTTVGAGSGFTLSRMRILVAAAAGDRARDTVSTATHDVTFTAVNSGDGNASTSVCSEGRDLP